MEGCLGLTQVPIFYEQGDFYVTSDFGERVHPVTGEVSFHSGIDGVRFYKGVRTLAKIVAIADGEVIDYDTSVKGYSDVHTKGNYVKLRHKSGRISLYLHLEYGSIPEDLRLGVKVKKGAIIGTMGATGRSTSAHIHFQVYDTNGTTIINPKPFLLGEDIERSEDAMFYEVTPCKRGDKNGAVLNLQRKLCQQSRSLEEEVYGHSSDANGNLDGIFGKGLERTLLKVQAEAGLEETGICDQPTCNMLNSTYSELQGKINTAVAVLE